MPLGKDVSTNIKELASAHPDWPKKRRIAAAINGAKSAKGTPKSKGK